ncbi:lipocalin family protein [uncultured Propionivibrio sp.]|uniref:lipocalin family protein n=1 Tax=uncultured Propionivibrio sp. TaxID=426737 RepID=UPI0029BFC582|nr:lipocalin family protein [uncultured Propionivibrio sp.]
MNKASTQKMTIATLPRCALAAALIGLLPLPAMTAEHTAAGTLTTIATLDVPRYMGRWHEIAKYPNRFQKQCVGSTQAEYSLEPDGRVRVLNRCRVEGGGTQEAIGIARQAGDADSAKLKVRFAPAWLSFLPWVWGDYWVIDLDRDYQLVAVSEPTRQFLWILSRTPTVAPENLNALVHRLRDKGFDIDKLEMTPQ